MRLPATLSLSLALATGDPPPPRDLPSFWTGRLEDVEREILSVGKGSVETIALSPGGRPVRAVVYGKADDLRSRANYGSAVGAGNAAYYARKDATTKPVVLLLGPVHGQEIEGIVGLVNLVHVAETGQDHRGRAWPRLARRLASARVVIVPCPNPDGRARCPYDSFVGLPTRTMTKYGQGTRRDGSLWGWPGAKSLHPMRGDVGVLGAYFDDDGVNLMHDDFFLPMARETEAILRLARREAPDVAVSLHSHEHAPVVLQTSHVPVFMKERIRDFSARLKGRHEHLGLPYGRVLEPEADDPRPGLRSSFNLTSALHHVSGAMAFTFECSHGSLGEESPTPLVSHARILDVQLTLYEEVLGFAVENRLLWTLPEGGRPTAGGVRIETAGTGRAVGPARSRGRGWYASFRLDVPKTARPRLRADNGGLHIGRFAGEAELHTVNGGIHVEGGGGHLPGETVNGGIHLDLRGSGWEGEGLSLRTTNGGLHVEAPAAYNARLEASTVNGGVHADAAVVTRTGHTGGRIEADLGQGGPRLRVETTNGGLHLERGGQARATGRNRAQPR